MAASIKMDELLVSWLGTDNVYENVMSLIEKKKHEPASESEEEKKTDNNASSADLAEETPVDDPSNAAAGDKATGTDDSTAVSEESLRGVIIPPFYVRRPPTGPSKDSVGAGGIVGGDGDGSDFEPPVYRRPRSGSCFADDQTWDGTGVVAGDNQNGTGGGGTGTAGAAGSNNAATSENFVSSPSSVNSAGGPGLDAATPISEGDQTSGKTDGVDVGAGGADGINAAGPLPCIRDQVRSIYDELGMDPPLVSPARDSRSLGGGDNDGDDNVASSGAANGVEEAKDNDDKYDARYLPVDSFVRITKEVCQFPTFFNGPLYKRILDLWNVKRKSGDDGALANHISAASTVDTENDAAAAAEGAILPVPSPNSIGGDMDVVTYGMFRWYWKKEMENYDATERFFRLIKQPDAEYIQRDDFLPYVKELLKDHPGLEFLSNHAEFQEKYAITVITRIFYSVNRCHDGRITSRQIRRSDLLPAFQQVDEEEDINKVTRYFSYEHFYVLYCRFWELDHDRDYRITREDLLKYGDHCLSHMIVDRIFDAAPRPFVESGPWTGVGGEGAAGADGTTTPSSPPLSPASADSSEAAKQEQQQQQQPKGVNREFLSYEDFIFFMLSEEDKANEISIRYWFSCIDVDGDGRLNNMEMRSFYAVQLHRMQCMGHEIVPFEDMLCQMIDMIKPASNDSLIPEDFLKPECSQVSGALFDALFNLNKYLLFEQRDPFMERQKREDEFDTDWDRFACIDYNRLAMEEEAREEEAMEIDWVTVDDEDDDGEEFNALGMEASHREAPF